MVDLPVDVQSSIARGVGAYLRATPAEEVPGPLKRFKGYRPQALGRHRTELVAALDDPGLRGRIVEWLDDSHPKLAAQDADRLRRACERAQGWERDLAGRRAPTKRTSSAGPSTTALRDKFEKERALVKKAREEARRAKQETQRALQEERATVTALRKQVADLKAELTTTSAAARAAHKEVVRLSEQLEREQRKSRSAAQKATTDLEAVRKELKGLRSDLAARPKASSEPRRAAARPASSVKATARRVRGPRPRLRAPKGRLQDDPETLSEWLEEPDVELLIDGYNVTKSAGGFGHLELETQRDRLVEGVAKLARSKQVPTVIVFDGSEVPPGTSRRPRGPASVEYSRASETADDHLVALVEKLPPVPVVLVTNDRDLQNRAAAKGATIATARQLLALIR